jgi:2-polyprenyl-3-methyl-5-hydroxy-6-metoxy-1,4-benzoquinol methylase
MFTEDLKKIGFDFKNFLLKKYFQAKYLSKLKLERTAIIRELMEYMRLRRSEILIKLSTSGDLVIAKWKEMNPKTPEEVLRFYQTCEDHIFTLSCCNYFSPLLYGERREVAKKARGRCLDYGGGVGSMCTMLTENDQVNEVSYYDLPSPVMKFARWRFDKRGLDIIVISGSENQDKLEGIYDTIICLDVLEHLTNPEFHVKRLERHLAVGGQLFVTAAFATDASYPLHFESERILNEMLWDAGLSPRQIIFGRVTLATKK